MPRQSLKLALAWRVYRLGLVDTMTSAVLNTAYLSTYIGVPEPTIRTLIDTPSPELVASFLHQLVVKAQDHDKLKAERLRLDVELENAVRSGEAKVRAVKAIQEKAIKDADTLQEKLIEKGESGNQYIARESLTIIRECSRYT